MIAPSSAADCCDVRSQNARSTVSGSGDASRSDTSSYPGGKSGAGIYQRLINLIPRHRVLIVPFAGRCGVTRRIRPAEHTILIDRDADVCQWWDDWSRLPAGRAVEIHHCDGIEWLRYRCGVTRLPRGSAAEPGVAPVGCDALSGVAPVGSGPGSVADPSGAAGESVTGRGRGDQRQSTAAALCGGRGSRKIPRLGPHPAESPIDAAEAFVLADPPYVMSERSAGRIYEHELTDGDHLRLLEILTQLSAAEYSVMVCGYASPLYASLELWRQIHHRVPTRGGLQDEVLWLNYPEPELLHDHRYVGRTRRERERIRRRQKTVTTMLAAMDPRERAAMLEVISSATNRSN